MEGVLAAILESGDPERLYTGLSLLVSAASEGRPARGLVTFGALGALLDPDLEIARAAPRRTWSRASATRSRARSAQLRDAAAELPDCRIWACAAAVQAHGADWGDGERAPRGRDLDAAVPARGGGRAARRHMRRARRARSRALAVAGCGAPAPDLFEVRRSGGDRNANLTLLVSDDGSVTCNGRKHPISDEQLLEARAARARARRRRPSSTSRCRPGRTPCSPTACGWQAGEVSFADTSRPLPQSFSKLTAFTEDVSENVCGLSRR